MKLLRETIRRLILESEDTLTMLADLLLHDDPEFIKQGWVLGNSMGLIENYESHEVYGHGVRRETVTVHKIIIADSNLLYEIRVLAQSKPFDWHHKRSFEFKRADRNKGIITITTRD